MRERVQRIVVGDRLAAALEPDPREVLPVVAQRAVARAQVAIELEQAEANSPEAQGHEE